MYLTKGFSRSRELSSSFRMIKCNGHASYRGPRGDILKKATLWFLLLIRAALHCCADQITVPATDHLVNQYPPGDGYGWGWYSQCDQFTETTGGGGYNVSFSFVGTSVTVNFITQMFGGVAQIGLDGSNVTTVNTFNASTTSQNDCAPISWSSGNIVFGEHTVAVYPLGNVSDLTFVAIHNFAYLGQPPSGGLSPAAKKNTSFHTNISSQLRNETIAARLIIPASLGVVGGFLAVALLAFCIAFVTDTRQKSRFRKQDSSTVDPSPSNSKHDHAKLGSSARRSNWNRSLQKCILSSIAVAGASISAYALSESQPFGAISSTRVSTLLLQLAGLLPQIGVSSLALEYFHMGMAARLNGDGLALSQLELSTSGLDIMALITQPSALLHKGSFVRNTAITLGVIASLLRFTLDAYPLLPGGLDGRVVNATFTKIGEQIAGCPSCADLTSYLSIANSITTLGNARLRANLSGTEDAIIVPPSIYSLNRAAGPNIETEQDTLKLTSCQHTNLTAPVVRVGDMNYSTEAYGRTVFGLADGVFRLSMIYGENGSLPNPTYQTMECKAGLTRYKYIQDFENGGRIQIIHELNSSTLPVYNLSWPGFAHYVYAESLQLEYINDETVGTRDFIGMMVAMLGGTRLLDFGVPVVAGRQTGPFRLHAMAVILLTATSVAAWMIGAGLLLLSTYRAGCVLSGAGNGLLVTARHGQDLDRLLQGSCNSTIGDQEKKTVVRARKAGVHLEIGNGPSREKVGVEDWLA